MYRAFPIDSDRPQTAILSLGQDLERQSGETTNRQGLRLARATGGKIAGTEVLQEHLPGAARQVNEKPSRVKYRRGNGRIPQGRAVALKTGERATSVPTNPPNGSSTSAVYVFLKMRDFAWTGCLPCRP